MGLVRCPDCNHQISDRAPACIHCGRPMEVGPAAGPPADAPPPPPSRRSGPSTLSVAGGLLLAGGLVCLPADRPKLALAGLGAGLVLSAVGALWSWVRR